ncbi:amino acid ABC transporter permease [Kaistia sp. 32K]|uniref:amino acid ABC transporter permease n=1 Tax=Kaistia sp. 32K TaxID=2795690 RepID=UPI00191651E0|nr:amino acid ABC transporter permease [Kaistia sp. 32K]BCP53254.1 amino acid ABC transporter permease [Kaistia sp. 32K]
MTFELRSDLPQRRSLRLALGSFASAIPTRLTGDRLFGVKVGLVWTGLFVILIVGFVQFGLDGGAIAERLPFMLGIRLTPSGMIQGAAMTLFVTASAVGFAGMLGLVTAMGRMSSNPFFFGLATFYGSLFRGTPLLIQVLLIYLALPQIGIILGPLTSGILALSLNYGAYNAEIVRSGVRSVPAGQWEAAMSLGLPRWRIAWKVIAPQALRFIIPPAGAQVVSMLKDSALVSLMGVWELNFLAQSYGRSTYKYMEMLTTAAAIYWMMSIILEFCQAKLERRFGRGYPGARANAHRS